MANKDIVKGAEPCGFVYPYQVYVAEAALYPGDFVKKHGSGTVDVATAGDTVALNGVAMHYAAAGAEVLVADHPDQLFVIQADDGTVDAQTDIGLNYNIICGTASTLYKRSGMELDGDTGGTLATRPLKLIRIDRRVDNALGANCLCVVRINNHQSASGTGSDGV